MIKNNEKRKNLIKQILIDPEDAWIIERYKIHFCSGYPRVSFDCKTISLHRMIMNPPAGMVVDHINGNRMDCRKINLRICTYSQNSMNQRKKRGYKGVYFRNKQGLTKPYMAAIKVKGETIHLGCHTTQKEAELAYDEAAKRFFGEFASLNHP